MIVLNRQLDELDNSIMLVETFDVKGRSTYTNNGNNPFCHSGFDNWFIKKVTINSA